jgi:glycosyltransferase involved in cell wall biosynthesis
MSIHPSAKAICWRDGRLADHGLAVKVAFDSRAVSDPNGVGRYSRFILKALGETVAAEDELLESSRPSATMRARNPDVFHSPWMDGAMLHSPCPMVVTVHDVAALKRPSERLRGGLRLRLRHLAVQRAAGVIVPTETVAADAVEHLQLERERIAVIPEAADTSMYPRSDQEIEAARQQLKLPARYLVWVGDLQHPAPGKQLAKLAAAARELPLVLVGPTRPWAHELPGVILTGQVSDEQLARIYSGAHALVLPCESVGLGLTAVEALACGTPVVACDAPALREVLADRATFVAAGDIDGLIAVAEGAARPAPSPAPSRWSWQDAGRATWNAYAKSLAALAAPRPHRAPRRQPAAGPRAQ